MKIWLEWMKLSGKVFLIAFVVLAAFSCAANAQERIFKRDAYGAVEYSKGSLETRKDGVIVHRDEYGATQYSKGSYIIKGDTIYQRDAYGAIQYSKGSQKIKPSPKGR